MATAFPKSPRWRDWAACALLWLSCGCAHRATVSTWKPAEVDVAGLQRLAVLNIAGDHGSDVASILNARLSAHEFYAAADLPRSRTIQPVSGTTKHESLISWDDLNVARDAGIDGLVVGEVLEYRSQPVKVAEDPLWSWMAHREEPPPGSPSPPTEPEPAEYDAAVSISFRLVDVKTGNIRASKQVHRTSRDIVRRPTDSPRSSSEVMRELTELCVDDFIATLTPHQVAERVTLAEPVLFQAGFSLVANGNELAARGRWDEAIVAYEQALSRNPNNEAALYNLSIAHAGRQQFSRAEDYAIRAMNVRQKEMYQTGLQRVRDQTSAYDQTLQQRRDLSELAVARERECPVRNGGFDQDFR